MIFWKGAAARDLLKDASRVSLGFNLDFDVFLDFFGVKHRYFCCFPIAASCFASWNYVCSISDVFLSMANHHLDPHLVEDVVLFQAL